MSDIVGMAKDMAKSISMDAYMSIKIYEQTGDKADLTPEASEVVFALQAAAADLDPATVTLLRLVAKGE
jgi:hypothetical protein